MSDDPGLTQAQIDDARIAGQCSGLSNILIMLVAKDLRDMDARSAEKAADLFRYPLQPMSELSPQAPLEAIRRQAMLAAMTSITDQALAACRAFRDRP